MMVETSVIIVGAGPSGLATAACLSKLSIPYVLLEREDCFASLWKKKAYDRLNLHLPKQYCQLPYFSLPPTLPNYVSKDDFVQYLDNYVAHFDIKTLCQRHVTSAKFDQDTKKWHVLAKNFKDKCNGGMRNDEEETEKYIGRFLVVATGESTDPYLPEIEGLSSFPGKVVHTSQYKSGKEYEGKSVLVVGAGNSGMEIALDLANHGANTSIVVRSPVHILSRRMMSMALFLLKYLPCYLVDNFMVILSTLVYGDMTKYGLTRPNEGPIHMKVAYGKYPIIDVGTIGKIKSGEIQVVPAIASIRGNEVMFEGGKSFAFNAIIIATGYKRSTKQWLEGGDHLLNDDGLPKSKYPEHWKGKAGLYSAGLARRGLYGAAMDAENICRDINKHL